MGPCNVGLEFALKTSVFADYKLCFSLCPVFCVFVSGEANELHDQEVICGPFTWLAENTQRCMGLKSCLLLLIVPKF